MLALICVGCESAVYSNYGGDGNLAIADAKPLIINDVVADSRALCFEEATFGSTPKFLCVTVGHFREWARSIEAARSSSVPPAQESSKGVR